MKKINRGIGARNYRKLERVVKGFSNHRRIEILELIARESEISVREISSALNTNYKTISEHIRRMTIAGLIIKCSAGNSVRHKITLRGETILKFLRTLE
ncbi:winged helix-turn-helix transcriptional regulator [PVC group bacterium]|nr:winged helix-turn-helix transcriptional regulator [PVC group bacterium]